MDHDRRTLADRHLQTSIDLNDRFPPAYYRLAKLMSEIDRDGAIENIEAAVRLDQQLTAAKYQLAQLYLDSAKDDEGARLLNEVGEAKQLEHEEEQLPQFRTFKQPSNPYLVRNFVAMLLVNNSGRIAESDRA